jgi:hypothetical protein
MLSGVLSENIHFAVGISIVSGYIFMFTLLVFLLPPAALSNDKIVLKKREYFFNDICEINIKRMSIKDEPPDVGGGAGGDNMCVLMFYIVFIVVFVLLYYLLRWIFSKSKWLSTYKVTIKVHNSENSVLKSISFTANSRAVDYIKNIAEIKGIKFLLQQDKKKKNGGAKNRVHKSICL